MIIPIPNVTATDPVCFLGVDLGQRESHTAFVTIERFDEKPAFTDLLRGAQFITRYIVRQAERLPLGTPYPEAIDRLRVIVQKLTQRGTLVVIPDESGAGIPIVELIKKELWGSGARIVPCKSPPAKPPPPPASPAPLSSPKCKSWWNAKNSKSPPNAVTSNSSKTNSSTSVSKNPPTTKTTWR